MAFLRGKPQALKPVNKSFDESLTFSDSVRMTIFSAAITRGLFFTAIILPVTCFSGEVDEKRKMSGCEASWSKVNCYSKELKNGGGDEEGSGGEGGGSCSPKCWTEQREGGENEGLVGEVHSSEGKVETGLEKGEPAISEVASDKEDKEVVSNDATGSGPGEDNQVRTTDPVLQRLVDSIVLSPAISGLLEKDSQLTVLQRPVEQSSIQPEGREKPFPNIIDSNGEMSFQVKQNPKSTRRGGVLAKVAGVYPDRLSRIRKELSSTVANLNSLSYQKVIYDKAKNLGELELEALDRQVTYETIRLEAGVGDPDKLSMARARAVQAEVDLSAIARVAKATGNEFLSKTGVLVGDVPGLEEAREWLFDIQPADVNFYTISEMAVKQSQNTEEASVQIQSIASAVLFGGEELLAQKLCVVVAAEALQRTRMAMDGGGSSESELEGALALLLGSQKKEMLALARYIEAHCAAYSGVNVTEFNVKIDPVNISAGGANNQDSGVTWFVFAGAFLLAVAIILGLYRYPDGSNRGDLKTGDDSDPSSK